MVLWLIFLREQTKKSSPSIAYWLYFLIIVFVVGINGSLISALPLYKNGFDINSTSLSLIGYAIVLLCSSSIELIFIDLKEKENKRPLQIKELIFREIKFDDGCQKNTINIKLLIINYLRKSNKHKRCLNSFFIPCNGLKF